MLGMTLTTKADVNDSIHSIGTADWSSRGSDFPAASARCQIKSFFLFRLCADDDNVAVCDQFLYGQRDGDSWHFQLDLFSFIRVPVDDLNAEIWRCGERASEHATHVSGSNDADFQRSPSFAHFRRLRYVYSTQARLLTT